MERTSVLASVHQATLASLLTVQYRVQPLGQLPPVTIPLNPFTLVHAARLAFLYHDALYRGAKGTTVGLSPSQGRVSYVQAVLVVWTLVFAGPTLAAVLRGQPAPLLVDPEAGLIAAIYACASRPLPVSLADLPSVALVS